MKKTLRKKFILFAMSAVTVLLLVLVGAINGFSWIILDRQSDNILHTIASGDDMLMHSGFRERGPFMPSVNMDIIQSTRFFLVHTDQNGNVLDVNIDRVSSVSEEQAAEYAGKITDTAGKIGNYKYEVKRYGEDRLIFFIDTSGQLGVFVMVLSITSAIAFFCWIATLLFVIMLSGRAVRPILAGMEKQKQFITNAGHELKTPLSIIQTNNDASALIYGETKYSRNIRNQTKRLNVLMTNLLTLASLDEETKLPVESVDISELIREMLSAGEDMITQKHITLSSEIQPGIFMQVNRNTFAQMISILLDNAVKYTPEGGTICFSLMDDGGHIEIAEENTCETPADPDPERLFERFYRGDSARTQSSPSSGYGIGLSAARAIAETFGGMLSAEYSVNGTIRFFARF